MSVVKAAKPKQSLAQKLSIALRERILSGEFKEGDKLPTEQQLTAEHGVSRTVVREAIATLRADRLIEARQGSGAFVLPPPQTNHLALWDEDSLTISSIIETLELRAAVEIEAAALAAQRCSPAQEARILESYQAMAQAVEDGQQVVEADRRFHIAIAEATNNRQFVDFLEYLGRRTIPRSQLRQSAESSETLRDHEQRLLAEHDAIQYAICTRDPEGARDAMRRHLKGSLDRYRQAGMAKKRIEVS